MPWCSQCGAEYDPGVKTCADCDAPIVDTPPQVSIPGAGPVVVLEANSAAEAEIVRATLEAEGIPAYVQRSGVLPTLDPTGDEPPMEVLVAPTDAERAAAVLQESRQSGVALADDEESSTETDMP